MCKVELGSDMGYKPASEIKASGGLQPRKLEGASYLAQRGKNAGAFLNSNLTRQLYCDIYLGFPVNLHINSKAFEHGVFIEKNCILDMMFLIHLLGILSL